MPTDGETSNYLPVPEINDNLEINHSFKQLNNKEISFSAKRPPKLKPRHHDANKSLCSSALAISFKKNICCNNNDGSLLSSIYKKSSSISYYDQCFVTIKKIGEGSFSEVFKVRSKEDGYLYAVKKSKNLYRSGNYRDERLQEVKRYEEFSENEHCITLFKAWEENDRLYMQMELCQGSLEDYLQVNKTIPENKIWSILLDLLLALKGLHDKNLIHLDIKLDNILLGDDGFWKLGDFGLVLDIGQGNLCDPTEGDCRYIAPEILMGNFTKSADIFSLGIAILELSCQLQLPSNDVLWHELRSGILPIKFTNKLSAELLDVIRSMMSPNFFQRPSVEDLLRHERIIAIINKRKRWKIMHIMKSSFKITKYLWAKFFNLQMFVLNYILNFANKFNVKGVKNKQSNQSNYMDKHIYTSDSSSENFVEYSTSFELSNDSLNDSSSLIVNSTPLHHYQGSIRSRKDLSKNIFSDSKFNSPLRTYSSETADSVIKKKLFFKSDDSD